MSFIRPMNLDETTMFGSGGNNRMNNRKIQEFTGVKSGDIGAASRWLYLVEIYFQRYGIVDEEEQLREALVSLGGAALDWAITRRTTFKGRFSLFSKAFLQRFEPVEVKREAMDQLNQLRYKGSVNDLYEKFLSLTIHLPERSEEILKNDFFYKLPNNIQSRILSDLDKPNLEEMVSHAIRLEKLNIREKNSSNHTKKNWDDYSNDPKITPSFTSSSSSNSSRRNKSTGKKWEKQERVPNNLFNERRSQGLCGACGEKDHTHQNCPTRAKKTSETNAVSTVTTN